MGRGWGVGAWSEGRSERRRRGRSQGGKVPAWTSEGFEPLKGISKYITFKGSKGRDLLYRRIFSLFLKPLKGFYKKEKNRLLRKDQGKRVWEGRGRREGAKGTGKGGYGTKGG